MAAGMLSRCAAGGKTVTPGNIAHYTVQLMKAGRRSTGSRTTDVLGTMTLIRGRSRTVSAEHLVSSEGGEPMTLADLPADDREDPAGEALRMIDWVELEGKLTPRERAVASALEKQKPDVLGSYHPERGQSQKALPNFRSDND